MEKVNRLLINICSDHLPESKAFYTQLFNFEIAFDSDWFIQLHSPERSLELGIIARGSEFVPPAAQAPAAGFYLTLVVEAVDRCYQLAQSLNYPVEQAPEDTSYGQRRMLIHDPNGVVLDVSSPMPNFNPGTV